MRKKKLVKRTLIVMVVLLLPIGAFTLGYFFKEGKIEEKNVANTLTVDGQIGGSVVGADIEGMLPEDEINKTINVKPNATADSLIRVKIEPNWSGEGVDNSFSSDNIELIYADDVIKDDLTNGKGNYWYKSTDGYLYYMNSVTQTEEPINIVKGIKFTGGTNADNVNRYQGKTIKINVTMDMVQCSDYAYENKWNLKGEENDKLKEILNGLCSPGKKLSK